jgi:hypothetical protein
MIESWVRMRMHAAAVRLHAYICAYALQLRFALQLHARMLFTKDSLRYVRRELQGPVGRREPEAMASFNTRDRVRWWW